MPSSELVGMAVSPFLKEHIPSIYAPIGKEKQDQSSHRMAVTTPVPRKPDPNSKFCYRHRPDSKCRRAADETKMAYIQSVSSLNMRAQA
jgi:F-box/WD-40 domain protein MET30